MQRLFEEAKRYITGGVNSPVRAFKAVGGTPLFIASGEGARIRDAEGGEYIDYVGSWGPLIAGHAHPRVVAALQEQAARGSSYGMPCELETELARMICERVPSCDRVRFVSSGTEATMSAIRLARGATKRDEIIKVQGCYHGHVDSLLVQAGSGLNDSGAVERLMRERGKKIACIILEPVAGNMGVVPPAPGYLDEIRELTRRHGVLMILDEVMTGFRVARSCAQGLYEVEPDLSCFGKVIGGGLPAAAYGGRTDLMEQMAPTGPVYQAGTLSGNPLAMCAGIETLKLLDEPGAYERLESVAARLYAGIGAAAERAGVPLTANRVGSMMTAFFNKNEVTNYVTAIASDTEMYAAFFRGMLSRGVFLAPSQFEAAFVSLAHGEAEVDVTIKAAEETLKEIAR